MSTLAAQSVLTIAAAAFDACWEGLLIAGTVWLALRWLPALGAATRYAIWLCTLVALVLTPVLTVALSRQPSAAVVDAPAVTGQRTAPDARAIPAPSAGARASSTLRAPVRAAHQVFRDPPAAAMDGGSPDPAATPTRQFAIPPALAAAVALLWLLLAAARAVRLVLNVRELAAIGRDARLWSTSYDYPVFRSDRVQVPIAVGFRQRKIVLPTPLTGELQADALEAIVIHEVAHLRRYDVWTNALARLMEAALVLSPAAWFVMRRLAAEREVACDDWVVARTGSGESFARTLLAMAGARRGRAPLGAPSAAGSRSSIVERIERLIDPRPRRLRLSPSALTGAFVLLALLALIAQSVSPVLAYAPPSQASERAGGTVQMTGSCAVPNRPVLMTSFLKLRRRALTDPGQTLSDPRTLTAAYGAANVATVELSVDAMGRPRKVFVLSVPRYAGMAEHVRRIMMGATYEPALRDCVPVATTVRTGLHFGKPQDATYSIVVPAYPNGWSTRHHGACKVPTLQHTGVPALPASMQHLPIDATVSTSARVHVGAGGSVTSATILTPSGRPALDAALLAAARAARYPLTEATGFKQARPSHTPLSWNAAHGSDTYVHCDPLPTDYVWNTTFARLVPTGIPGSGFIILSSGT